MNRRLGRTPMRPRVLTAPQTSGGLLIAGAADDAAALVHIIVEGECPSARVIGHVESGASASRVGSLTNIIFKTLQKYTNIIWRFEEN